MLRTAFTYLQDPGYLKYVVAGFLPMIIVPVTISMLGVITSILVSQQFNVLARPTARGSHSVPTPRLGGLGAALGFYVSALLMPAWIPIRPSAWYTALLVGGAWALVGGALDDVFELPPRWKTLVQFAAAGSPIALGYWPSTFALPLLGSFALPAPIGMLLVFLFVMLMMNVVNFMDGMDGHAAAFTAVTAVYLALFLFIYGFLIRFLEYASAMALASCAIGLLAFNHPGRAADSKTFMGDSGSQFFGYALAIICLRSSEGPMIARFPLIASLILFSPFIYDVVYTMILRYRRGEDLTQAHREHLYQRLMVAGWSHGKALQLTIAVWLTLGLLAFCYAYAEQRGFALAQLMVIGSTAAALFGYTKAVQRVEQDEARLRGN
jgi:UDP-N-acetylmuramyl pentapeptide phosphotransferase/UDP-N-acetylglucosamine-1-phosphate transferase